MYIHRAAPPPTTGVRTKLIKILTPGQAFVDAARNIGLEFTSLTPATDSAVVTLVTAPVILTNPTSVGPLGVGAFVNLTVTATGYSNRCVCV